MLLTVNQISIVFTGRITTGDTEITGMNQEKR